MAVKVLLGMAAAIAEDGENALLQQTAELTFSSPVLESLQKVGGFVTAQGCVSHSTESALLQQMAALASASAVVESLQKAGGLLRTAVGSSRYMERLAAASASAGLLQPGAGEPARGGL